MLDTTQTATKRLFNTVLALDRLGLVSGSSGNASVRLDPVDGEARYLITPAKIPYSELSESDLVAVNDEIEPIDEETLAIPSSEALLHIAAYRARSDIRAVVHTHSIFASVLAVRGCALLPIVDEMVVHLGGSVEVSEYGFPGTGELAENVVRALGDRGAALIRHHGMMAVGSTIEEAFERAVLVERIAQIFIYCENLGDTPTLPSWAVDAGTAAYMMNNGLYPKMRSVQSFED